jgi:hypothetical protein
MAVYEKTLSVPDTEPESEPEPSISLFARWMPRETSKRFGWFFRLLSEKTHSCYFKNPESKNNKKAQRKAYMHLRKNLAKMNRHLDTTQIHQCAGEYAKIDYHNVTSKTLHLQQLAFSNLTQSRGERYPDNADRIQAANKFESYVNFEHKSFVYVDTDLKPSIDPDSNNGWDSFKQQLDHERYVEIDMRFNSWFVTYVGGGVGQ